MIEKPVMFSAPMVLAVLEGRKTQTRRLAKPRRRDSLLNVEGDQQVWADSYITDPGNVDWLMSDAAHRPGEGLWVRENFRFELRFDWTKPREVPKGVPVYYEADDDAPECAGKLHPSIHMPRWASRIDLTCTATRVERLHAITEADAIAEGIWEENVIVGSNANGGRHSEETGDRFFYRGCPDEGFESAVEAYIDLWAHLHGQASWDANPLVWVYSFSVTRAPT